MNNKFENDDFFDQELEKKQIQEKKIEQARQERFSTWTEKEAKTDTVKAKRVTALLVAVALVFSFALGFLCNVFFNSNSADVGLLREVLSLIREIYYDDLTDAEWDAIIANGGTAMFQTIDGYGYLLTPQQAYDVYYPLPEDTSSPDGYFGFSFQFVTKIGLLVSDVTVDSSAFGVLEKGDLVVSIDNLADKDGAAIVDSQNNPVSKIDFSMHSATDVSSLISKTHTADFSVLRNNIIVQKTLTRGKIGTENNEGNDKMHFVEYYFGDSVTNVSLKNENNAQTNTKEFRHLGDLNQNTGYIRLRQFDSYDLEDGVKSATMEFKAALDLFKESGKTKLIVDLKGNPGGYVTIATEIAGLLATADLLDQATIDSHGLKKSNGDILVTTLESFNGKVDSYFTKSSYSDYFSYNGTGTRDIVVWTDENSASASELLTGALLEYKTAIHMGTQTYGKGIAQTIKPLTNYSGSVLTENGADTFFWCIYHTSAKYYSPLGNNIHGVGYTPESTYNNLTTYQSLVAATNSYFS